MAQTEGWGLLPFRRLVRSTRRRWSPLLHALRSVRRAKSETRKTVHAAGLPLEPGLWLFNKKASLHHWRERPPQPPRSGVDGTAVTVAERWRLLVLGCPPHAMWVRGRRHGARQIMMSKDGNVIAIDSRAGVVHHYAATPFTAEYERRRDDVAEYLPAPDYRLWADRRRLTEALVAGEPVAAQRLDVKRQVLAELAARSVARSRSSQAAQAGDDVDQAIDLVRRAAVPDWLADGIEELATALRAERPQWPSITGHGDVTGANILVRPGPVWTTIDFEDARRVPFFYDALSLVLRDVDLRGCLDAGGHLPELDVLWAAVPGDSARHTYLALRVTTVLGAVHHARCHGGSLRQALELIWPRSQ